MYEEIVKSFITDKTLKMADFHGYFNLGNCEGEKGVDGETMPLVLEPKEATKNDVESLLKALKINREIFEESIIKNSAVLLRGFDVKNAEDFNEVIEVFGWEELVYIGRAVRTNVHKNVWTANEGPLSVSIYYHHEMVQFSDSVEKVVLYCEIPPPKGGETPLVPSFRVTERMVAEFPEIVNEMEVKGLRYTLMVPGVNDESSMVGRSWEQTFGTSDQAEAEKRGKLLGMEIEWLPSGGAKIMNGPKPLTQVFDGRKGRRMWFNSLAGFFSGKDDESVRMGDGTEIPENVVKRCTQIMEEESIQFKWERGDILFLDNRALLHGRRPSLPPRRVLVAIA